MANLLGGEAASRMAACQREKIPNLVGTLLQCQCKKSSPVPHLKNPYCLSWANCLSNNLIRRQRPIAAGDSQTSFLSRAIQAHTDGLGAALVSGQRHEVEYESPLTARHFYNEEAAYSYLEAHLWHRRPKCPHCGGTDRVKLLRGKTHRIGVYTCYVCVKPFTVKVCTLFHGSRVPMHTWLKGIYLVAGSRDTISAEELMHVLGVSRATAQYLRTRIRVAIKWRAERFDDLSTTKNMEGRQHGQVDATPGGRSVQGKASGAKRFQRFRL